MIERTQANTWYAQSRETEDPAGPAEWARSLFIYSFVKSTKISPPASRTRHEANSGPRPSQM